MRNEVATKIKKYFEGLEFDPATHTYNIKGKTLSSVSSVIKRFSEPFDADKIAGFVARKKGVTKEEVLAEWETKKNDACDRGHQAHYFGETYKKGAIPTNGYEKAIVAFWNSIPDHIEPLLFELQMFSDTLGIAGTSDIILYNIKTEKFIIADYKTNEDLFKNYKGKKLLPPFGHMLDNAYNKYQLQLSLYQLLFEQTGFEVESRGLIWLKPDGVYKSFKTEDLTKPLLRELTK
ncbi:MAG: hypothetical protein CV045_02910 [Cyanobacteria bacterium M5B4]|nr:MAG: hypothetical protein CV045_02910 [Cyanobacteria bacterium M5B4]